MLTKASREKLVTERQRLTKPSLQPPVSIGKITMPLSYLVVL